jgi:hypothetical protein
MTRIIIIDGMGGGIGAELAGRAAALVKELGVEAEIVALGTNASATEKMLRAGAQRGASGENAIRVSAQTGDFILGPIGIVIADSMMGEITQTMTEAVLSAPGERILLPMQNEHFRIAGLAPLPLAKQVEAAVAILRERLA